MKKWIKGFCIAAIALICFGVIFCIGGVAAGGAMTATGIMRDLFDRHGMTYGTSFVVTAPKRETIPLGSYGHEFDTDDVENLRIEANAAEVEIRESNSIDTITVSMHGRKNECDKDGKTIVIQKVRKGEKVTVEVPKNFSFDKVQITADAGEIAIESLQANLFELELGAGAAEIEKLTAKRIDFELGAGQIVVNDGDVRSCDVEVDMGSFEYNGVLCEADESADSRVEVDMGNAVFHLEGEPTDYNYSVECEIGTVTIGDQVYDATEESHWQGKHMNNNAESTFEIECSVGDVTIEFEGGRTNEEIDEVL